MLAFHCRKLTLVLSLAVAAPTVACSSATDVDADEVGSELVFGSSLTSPIEQGVYDLPGRPTTIRISRLRTKQVVDVDGRSSGCELVAVDAGGHGARATLEDPNCALDLTFSVSPGGLEARGTVALAGGRLELADRFTKRGPNALAGQYHPVAGQRGVEGVTVSVNQSSESALGMSVVTAHRNLTGTPLAVGHQDKSAWVTGRMRTPHYEWRVDTACTLWVAEARSDTGEAVLGIEASGSDCPPAVGTFVRRAR